MVASVDGKRLQTAYKTVVDRFGCGSSVCWNHVLGRDVINHDRKVRHTVQIIVKFKMLCNGYAVADDRELRWNGTPVLGELLFNWNQFPHSTDCLLLTYLSSATDRTCLSYGIFLKSASENLSRDVNMALTPRLDLDWENYDGKKSRTFFDKF